jgi:hypothetical protein
MGRFRFPVSKGLKGTRGPTAAGRGRITRFRSTSKTAHSYKNGAGRIRSYMLRPRSARTIRTMMPGRNRKSPQRFTFFLTPLMNPRNKAKKWLKPKQIAAGPEKQAGTQNRLCCPFHHNPHLRHLLHPNLLTPTVRVPEVITFSHTGDPHGLYLHPV